jgi:hypothetical protein
MDREVLPSLRASLDSNDSFVSGGHGIIRTAGATRHADRMKKVPVWALNDAEIKTLVKRCFPSPKQYNQAARMVVIIYKYYRAGDTAGKIAEELNMSLGAVKQALIRVNRVANRPAKSRGRPKRNVVPIQATNGTRESGEVRLSL